MNIQFVFALLAFVNACGLSGCASRSPKGAQPPPPAEGEIAGFRPWYSTRKFYYIGEPTQEAARHGYDFREIVARSAHKDPAALRTLLDMRECNFDGAAGEMHMSVIAEMMLLWGDYDFSRVLASTPRQVRKKWKSSFAEPTLRMCFPLTSDVLFGYRPPGTPKY